LAFQIIFGKEFYSLAAVFQSNILAYNWPQITVTNQEFTLRANFLGGVITAAAHLGWGYVKK